MSTIDGKKFLAKIGCSESNVTAELVRDLLFVMSDSEREDLFAECTVITREEPCMFLDIKKSCIEIGNYHFYSPVDIKKRLKYCKNPMERKNLQRELNDAYKKY